MRSADSTQADSELINRLCKRDPLALAAIYDRYAGLLYSLVLRITHHQSKAEDLVQELFLRLWNRAQLFERRSGCLETWLLLTARNMAIDQVRSGSARFARRSPATEYLPHRDDATDSRKSALQRAVEVKRALTSLLAHERQVLALAYFDGCSQAEIANLLNQPLANVNTWMQSGLNRLRRAVPGSDPRTAEAAPLMGVDSGSASAIESWEQGTPLHKP